MNQEEKQTFTNSTSQNIQKIYTQLNYIVPGKIYPSAALSSKQSHSLLTYGGKLLTFLLSIELKNILSKLTFQKIRTLHSVYKEQSLAILSNSVDLHAAICKAQEYNIPLLQISILSAEGERTVKEKVLTNFTISHFINQNFVLYGDWEDRQNIFSALNIEAPEKIGDYDPREGIYLRKGELIYAFISLEKIQKTDHLILQQNLAHVRNQFYLHDLRREKDLKDIVDMEREEAMMNLSEPSGLFEGELSGFGELGAVRGQPQAFQDDFPMENFNDSDQEIMEQ